MPFDRATVRQQAEKIDGVTRTWIEHEWREDGGAKKVLVVEVDFDTDPNSPRCRRNVIDAIETTVFDFLREETTMVISGLRIVPREAR